MGTIGSKTATSFRTSLNPFRTYEGTTRCKGEALGAAEGRSLSCTTYTRNRIIKMFFAVYFIYVIVAVILLALTYFNVSYLKKDEMDGFRIKWFVLMGISLIFVVVYFILYLLGWMAIYGSQDLLGRLISDFFKPKKRQIDMSILRALEPCENRFETECNGFYYKYVGGSKKFEKYKCKMENGKCTSTLAGEPIDPKLLKSILETKKYATCSKRGETKSKTVCELGGMCKYKNGRCTKKVRLGEPFRGQPIPFLGDDCAVCDEKDTLCNHITSGLVGSISFLFFGSLMVAFGAELKQDLEDRESSWVILGDVSIGLGCCYLLLGLGVLFFTMYCPGGSDWWGPKDDSTLGFFAFFSVSIVILFAGVGVPILANMGKLK